MKTRSKKNDQENHPALFDAKVSQKSTKSKIHSESPPEPGGSDVKKRFALKDNTNLNKLEVVCVKRSIKEEHSKKEVSGKKDLIREKVPHQSIVTPKQCALGSNSFCNYSDPRPDRVSNARRCVYMNTIPEEEEINDKECMYEFVVDKNEPPSRRRKKRYNKKIMNKPKGYPRKRVNSVSEESSVASSVVTSSFASSVNTSFGRNLSPKEAFVKKNEHPAETSVVSSNCQENVSSSPVESIVTLTKPSTVVSSDGLSSVSAYNDPSSVTSFTTMIPTVESCAIQHKRTSSIPSASVDPNAVGIEPPKTPNKSSLCNSSLWSEGPSVCLAMTKHHSTPCKSRSGSDSSSYFQLSEQVANKENCFGFSSDEDEEDVNDLPSPVHLSPHSRVHRQGLLSPQNAPSRFAPEVVKRALALKAVTKPLDFGSSKDGQAQRKLKVAENKKGKRVKLAERCSKRTKVGKEACVVSKAKLPCDASSRIAGDDKLRDTSCPSAQPDVESLTPRTECLFEDLEGKDDKFLKITPIRRSYGKPLQQKTRRVVGGGLCLESGDEDDLVMELDKKDETERALKGKGSPKLHRRRNKNNTEKKEKEIDAWASLMKSQFEEVDHFDLCVDKE